jgi:hypothetical protein
MKERNKAKRAKDSPMSKILNEILNDKNKSEKKMKKA